MQFDVTGKLTTPQNITPKAFSGLVLPTRSEVELSLRNIIEERGKLARKQIVVEI